MQIRPFFLQRRNHVRCLKEILRNRRYETVGELEKINLIHPETLKLQPINQANEGASIIHFDLEAAILLLCEKEKNWVFDYIFKKVPNSIKESFILLCEGSRVDDKVPFIKITPMAGEKLEIGTIALEQKHQLQNCYYLQYKEKFAA